MQYVGGVAVGRIILAATFVIIQAESTTGGKQALKGTLIIHQWNERSS